MNDYEVRKQERIDRLKERAAKKAAEAERLVKAGSDALAQIPLGQPILIGHHSEKRDRAYRGRAIGKIDRGMAESKQAEALARRADAAEDNHSISSDDPGAPAKLHERIVELEAKRKNMVEINRIVRSKPQNLSTPEKLEALGKVGLSRITAAQVFLPDFCGRIGIPGYALANLGGNIRRLKERLATLQAEGAKLTTETQHDGFTVREDAELNRVQFIFDGKPDEATRTLLKSYAFRWAPSEGAWQRQLNGNGRYAAKCVVEKLCA